MKNFSLHPDTVNEVKERVDLVEVISDYVVIQKKGKDFVGLCPFHDEKSPSFTVSSSKQMYYCFGCGAGGGAIKFLMEIGKQSFRDVILNLAQRYQIPIKTLNVEDQQEIKKQLTLREKLDEILAVATYFYQHTLNQEDDNLALQYLIHERGLSPENIQHFQLGYAPQGWDTLYHYLVEIKGYSPILVEQAGLIKKKQKGSGYIDYFRHRLIIPIQDVQGRVIAFGARSLDGSEPKYLNSPETELFSKSKTLFAINFAHNSIIKQDKVIVVEGYFDAIALHNVGIKNVVAVLGTALTEQHIKQLSRYSKSKEIIVNFDRDKAGIKATERAIKEVEKLIYSGQIKLKVITINQGKDADEFLKSNTDAVDKYKMLIDNASLWLDWQLEQIIKDKNLQKSDDYETVFNQFVQLLNKISNNATKDIYLSNCAEILSSNSGKFIGLNTEEFKKIYQSLKLALKPELLGRHGQKNKYYQSLGKTSRDKQTYQAEFTLLLIYLHCPDCREKIINDLDEKDLVFSLAHHRFLWQKIHQIDLNKEKDESNNLLLILQETILHEKEMKEKVSQLLYIQENYLPIILDSEHYIQASIACLETIKLEKYKQFCQQEINNNQVNNDEEKMSYFYREILKTDNRLKELKSLRTL